ncbi:MAG: hypothetical protein HY302_09630 [Opitutae bacterium]|nr:hypothetical protein [Opitutae bacterium]
MSSVRKLACFLLCLFLGQGAVGLRGQTAFTVQDNATNDTLQTINLATLAVTNVGPLGINYSFGDITWNPVTSTLFVVDGRGSNSLFRYDPATGAATFIGTHGITDLFGLAYDTDNNVLYGATFSGTLALYTLDQNTGTATLVGNTGVGIGGLAYDSTRHMLIGINDGGGQLFQLNTATGAATLLASPGGTNDSGISFDPVTNRLFAFDFSGNLFSYDIANNFARTTLLTGQGAHDGIAVVTSPIPEPAAWAQLGAGLGALFLAAGYRRRQSRA